jgi:hypothetical protein
MVADRLSVWMLLITALLACFALLYAVQGTDSGSRHFHPLFQLQLFGLNGAFLTGDLFNLFVFFEVLLLASYGLLLHGGGASAGARRAALRGAEPGRFDPVSVRGRHPVRGARHLNMADLAVKVAATAPEDLGIVRAAGLLLFTVFALKAALFAAVSVAAGGLRRHLGAGGGAVRHHDQGRCLCHPAGRDPDLRRRSRAGVAPHRARAAAAGLADAGAGGARRAVGAWAAPPGGLSGDPVRRHAAHGLRVRHPRGHRRGAVLPAAQHLRRRRAVPVGGRHRQGPRRARPTGSIPARRCPRRRWWAAVLPAGGADLRTAAAVRFPRQMDAAAGGFGFADDGLDLRRWCSAPDC